MTNKLIHTVLNVFTGCLFLLFIISFSFNFHIIPDIGGWCAPLFEFLASFTQSLFTEVPYVNYSSGEDSLGLYYNLLNIISFSGIFTLLIFNFFSIRKVLKLVDFFRVVVRYYVILMLIYYGFDKVYKMQFSLPEPNIEFTRVKDLHSDILFWTTMGKSYSYSLITGLLEVAAGTFLMFYKTRLLGVMLSVAIFTQVLLINIGFDVTMKVFSAMLLLMSLYMLAPYLKMLSRIFFTTYSTAIVIPSFQSSLTWGGYKKYIKVFIILLIITEGNFKAFSTGNFNDDLQERPYANGAFEVESYSLNGEELAEQRWNYFYVHRNGYFIIELADESKVDFKMEFINGTTQMKITDYKFNESILGFVKHGNEVKITYPLGTDTLKIIAHQLSY
ncbi:MAG: hypothetical protein ACI8Q1_000534 [Parvicella sp.]|jgi:hypothetical protein